MIRDTAAKKPEIPAAILATQVLLNFHWANCEVGDGRVGDIQDNRMCWKIPIKTKTMTELIEVVGMDNKGGRGRLVVVDVKFSIVVDVLGN